MRLQRALARAGFSSRRGAEEMIRAGRVRVNGAPAHLGMSVDPERDIILVGTRRVVPARVEWIALHKPLGYVVTRKDPRGRPTVFDLVPPVRGLTYVGRLDVMTSGLLLLTTDGDAAHRLMHPRFAVERSYRVRVHGMREQEIRRALARPVVIERRPVRILRWQVDAAGRGSSDLTLVVAEGRYRIVRRLCEQLGLKVERLIRLSYGPLRLGTLEPGEWRRLTAAELRALGGPALSAVGSAFSEPLGSRAATTHNGRRTTDHRQRTTR